MRNMYGKMRNKTVEKPDKVKNNKRGFTLVELTIVMAILAIVTGITVSFSVLMKDVTADNRDEYEFLEQNTELKDAICAWVAENDVEGSKFTANGDTLTVTFENSEKKMTLRLSNGRLYYSDYEQQKNIVLGTDLDEIDQMIFSVKGGQKLLRCGTNHKNDEGKTVITNAFVISLRLGTMIQEGPNET